MRIHSFVLSAAMLLSCSPAAFAEPITYGFAGHANGTALAGGFVLDDAAAWLVGGGSNPSEAMLSSSNQEMWGTFGEYAFQGVASLYVLDQPEFRSDGSDTTAPDYWIIRAPLTGTVQNGQAPMWLNLFVYTSAAGINGRELTPPAPGVNPSDFQFTLSFANTDGGFGSFTAGSLTSLERLPDVENSSLEAVLPMTEPGTLSLLALGCVVVGRSLTRR